jgi:hypothetical protein
VTAACIAAGRCTQSFTTKRTLCLDGCEPSRATAGGRRKS